MTVQDLYNILEKEIDAGNLTLSSRVYFYSEYGYSLGNPNKYITENNRLYLIENYI